MVMMLICFFVSALSPTETAKLTLDSGVEVCVSPNAVVFASFI